MNFYWTEDEVRSRLENRITDAFKNVLNIAREHNVNMRTAAYMVAVRRVAGTMLARKSITVTPIAASTVSS
jgi:glutamate dehydrogenase/leucine dehydrogenase